MTSKMSSIRFRLSWMMVVVVSLLLGGFGALDYRESREELEGSMQLQLAASLDRMSGSLPTPLWNFDEEQIRKILSAEMSAPFVLGVVVTDGEKVLAGAARDADGKIVRAGAAIAGADFRKEAPLSYVDDGKQKPVGVVAVYGTRKGIDDALRSTFVRSVLQILVLDLCIVLAMAVVLSRVVLVPLRRITEALHNIAKGDADLTQRLPRSDSREFAAVADNFNTFVQRLQTVMEQVRNSTDSISTAAVEIARGNADLSARTEIGASSLQQTAASMAEMAMAAKRNAENARIANEMVANASGSAQRGGSAVAEVVATMQSINESSRKVVEIIGVIDSIAFQTNILALNAAVEAARAGEQGRGFAVVASEVRSLAGRSAVAAKEIKALIDDSVSNIASGNARVEQAGTIIDEVVRSVERVNGVISDIMASSGEQTLGIDQINEAIAQMDNATQQNAALVEQSAATSEAMQHQARNLERQVAIFKLGDAVQAAPRRAGQPARSAPATQNAHRPAHVRQLAEPEFA